MTQNGSPNNGAVQAQSLQLTGGAAIVAPISMFPQGVPNNALVVLPLSKPTDELVALMNKGPAAMTQDQMWELLGFNGPAVQVQDNEGRPIAIGLEDLLAGLEKHWNDDANDLNRGRIVAKGGLQGDDWLALGVTQLQLEKLEKAESTLKGAQNIMKTNPFPSLHLAKVYKAKKDEAGEKAAVLKAIDIEPNAVDAWGYLFQLEHEKNGEEAAIKAVEDLATGEKAGKTSAPYIAIQGFFAQEEENREKAITWAKKAVERNVNDPLGLLCLSALYGQAGDLDKVIATLAPHEAKMARDVRLANNYFEALFQSRQLDTVTRFLNALAGAPDKEVKQFAIERSRAVAQYLQQQQAQLTGAK